MKKTTTSTTAMASRPTNVSMSPINVRTDSGVTGSVNSRNSSRIASPASVNRGIVTLEKNHAEIQARELFTAGAGGPELIVAPIVHRGSSKRKIGYNRVLHDDHDENDTGETNDEEAIRNHLLLANGTTTAAKPNNGTTTMSYHDADVDHNNNNDVFYNENEDVIDYDDSHIPDRSICHLFGINAFALAYGVILSTFGLIILPVESERLWPKKHAVLLAIFLGICGISQLSGPIAGFLSDRCTSSMGRRRPFLLFSSFVIIPSLIIMKWASNVHNLPVYLFCFFNAMLALNVMYVAYSGALTDLVNENQRGFANGLMGAFSVGGASFGFGCFSLFLTVDTGYIFYIIVVSVTVLISFLSWDERPLMENYHDSFYEVSSTSSPLSWTWKEIGECYWIDHIEHRDFFLVFVSRTLYYMGVSVQTFMLFYFRDVINSTNPQADVAFLALFGQLSGAIFCVPMGLLSNKTGRKALIYFSSAVIMGTYFMFMFFRTKQLAFLGGAIYGIGNGTYLSVDYALACDTIPNKDNAARYLGIWGVGAFVGTLFGPMLVGPALLYFGSFSGRVDDDGVPMYDALGYMVILGIGILCLFAGAVVVAPIRSAK